MFECWKKPQQDSIGYGESDTQLDGYKWGYIVPHTLTAQGAETHDGISEYRYGLVARLALTFSETRNGWGVKGACKSLINQGANASFEDHKNAYNTKVGGAEILVLYGDSLSEAIAERILEDFCREFGRVNRGVKKIRKGGRGYNNLKTAKKYFNVALLGEMFFIDNTDEWIDPVVYRTWLRSALV